MIFFKRLYKSSRNSAVDLSAASFTLEGMEERLTMQEEKLQIERKLHEVPKIQERLEQLKLVSFYFK